MISPSFLESRKDSTLAGVFFFRYRLFSRRDSFAGTKARERSKFLPNMESFMFWKGRRGSVALDAFFIENPFFVDAEDNILTRFSALRSVGDFTQLLQTFIFRSLGQPAQGGILAG